MLDIDGLAGGYGARPVARLGRLTLAPGEAALLTGPSGSGKTTLLLTIAGLVTSFLVRRRRVFVRAALDPTAVDPTGARATLVTIGALSKTADPGLAAALQGLADEIAGRSSGAASGPRSERT